MINLLLVLLDFFSFCYTYTYIYDSGEHLHSEEIQSVVLVVGVYNMKPHLASYTSTLVVL